MDGDGLALDGRPDQGSDGGQINPCHFFLQFVEELRLIYLLGPRTVVPGREGCHGFLVEIRAVFKRLAARHDCRGKGQAGGEQAFPAIALRQDLIDIQGFEGCLSHDGWLIKIPEKYVCFHLLLRKRIPDCFSQLLQLGDLLRVVFKIMYAYAFRGGVLAIDHFQTGHLTLAILTAAYTGYIAE